MSRLNQESQLLQRWEYVNCPFHDGNDCKEYEQKTQDSVSQTIEFVQKLEAANKTTEGSQMVFK